MIGRNKQSVLFVNPDYHASFLYCQELRKMGWRADVYRKFDYPQSLLYSEDCFTDGPQHRWTRWFSRFWFFFTRMCRYQYYIVYASPHVYNLTPACLSKIFGKYRAIDLWFLKKIGKKILYIPSGCNEEALQADYRKYYPNMCNNCGVVSRCHDGKNLASIGLRNRYGDLTLPISPTMPFSRIHVSAVKYKSLDLTLWHPQLAVPPEFQLPRTQKLRIMHSFHDQGRREGGKNIKGSSFIVDAIERLKREGYSVEYFYVNSAPAKHLRFYQVQADIIVDQLICGWWGSTGIEAMALGKPLVCFLHPDQKRKYTELYPDHKTLPVVEATVDTIYDALHKLVTDETYRRQCGLASRAFAEHQYDCVKNVRKLTETLLTL